ncbi:MAG: FecR domain-containing protein [Leptospira sp.]|nr:FecR domain-containing protein [Leptospira sp.]
MNILRIRSFFLIIALFSIGAAYNCKKEEANLNGIVSFLRGTALIEKNGVKTPAKSGQLISEGDTIETDANSTVIVEFGNAASIEVQSNSIFRISKTGKDMEFFQKKGNTWLSSSKLLKDQSVSLKTPTTVAGVRGTKFYTYEIGDIVGTCFCEGKVEMTNTASNKKSVNQSDYLVVQRGDKSVTITIDDLKKINLPYKHDHSELDNSKLGNKISMTPDEMKQMMGLIQTKLKEAN